MKPPLAERWPVTTYALLLGGMFAAVVVAFFYPWITRETQLLFLGVACGSVVLWFLRRR
jgi:uncharacterized membrane protein YhhN